MSGVLAAHRIISQRRRENGGNRPGNEKPPTPKEWLVAIIYFIAVLAALYGITEFFLPNH